MKLWRPISHNLAQPVSTLSGNQDWNYSPLPTSYSLLPLFTKSLHSRGSKNISLELVRTGKGLNWYWMSEELSLLRTQPHDLLLQTVISKKVQAMLVLREL